jgi:hypothetical protein
MEPDKDKGRALLVKIKRDLENHVRGLLKNLGLVIGRAKFNVSAIATLNRQRHLTPSCGGFTPTAERTMGPARTGVGELDTQTRN